MLYSTLAMVFLEILSIYESLPFSWINDFYDFVEFTEPSLLFDKDFLTLGLSNEIPFWLTYLNGNCFGSGTTNKL